MPGPIRRFVHVLASVALLSLALVFAGATTASAQGTWSSASDIDGDNGLISVSCPTASFCAAVDAKGNALIYNGSSWSSPSDVDGTNTLLSVSCPSANFCIAVDDTGDALTYNGSSWSSASDIDGSNFLEWVSCPSVSFCAAVDEVGNAVIYTATSANPTVSKVTPNTGSTSGGTAIAITEIGRAHV